jgi:hypothetical protein
MGAGFARTVFGTSRGRKAPHPVRHTPGPPVRSAGGPLPRSLPRQTAPREGGTSIGVRWTAGACLGRPPLPASPPQTARERGALRSRLDRVPRSPWEPPPPGPRPPLRRGGGDLNRASAGLVLPTGNASLERCASGDSAHAPGRPLSPALSPASRGKGEFDCARAGPAHSTARAVREGGLWAVVAATLVAPAGPGPLFCARDRTSTRSVPPLPRCLWERVDEHKRGRVRAPAEPRPLLP